jgi:hypothetical protein
MAGAWKLDAKIKQLNAFSVITTDSLNMTSDTFAETSNILNSNVDDEQFSI